MKLVAQFTLSAAFLGIIGLPLLADTVDSLWLGTLTRFSTGFNNVLQIDTSGKVLSEVADSNVSGTFITSNNSVPAPITGIATDGSSLYFGDSFGWIVRTTLDGSTLLGSPLWPYGVNGVGSQNYPGGTQEDMAWDPQRSVLWRISAATDVLQEIDPATDAYSATTLNLSQYPGPLDGLGLAYDSNSNLLYASFCYANAGGSCLLNDGGLVTTINPVTHALSTLFATGFTPGGLAFDSSNDSLWVTSISDFLVRDMSLTGGVIGQPFGQPAQDGQVVGLEIVDPVSTPEPGVLLPLGAVMAALCWKIRRRARRALPVPEP